MKIKTTRSALLLSALALLLCVSMLVGTTFAWFTDSVTSANNIIQAGNLDVELYYQVEGQADWTRVTGETNVFKTGTLWEPGHTEVVKLKIVNEGTLALQYQLGVNIVNEIGSVNAKGEAFKLSNHIRFGIVDGAQTYTRDQAVAAVDATATALKDGYNSDKVQLLPVNDTNTDNEDIVTMVVYMPESVGNEANHRTGAAQPVINLGINLFATQLVNESDSFGPDYDTNATYPAIQTQVAQGGDAITAGEVTVTLPAEAAEATYTIQVDNKSVNTTATGDATVSFDINLLKDGTKVEAQPGAEYPVSIYVGRNLILTGVTHKGVAVADYSYEPATGIVTFKTDSFSPFSVSYKANTYLAFTPEDIQYAITKDGTVILQNDIVIDKTTPFTYTEKLNGAHFYVYHHDLTLDLNGYSITVKSDAVMEGKTEATALFLVRYGNLTIRGNGTIETQNKAIPVYGWANGTVNIYSGKFVSNASARNESAVYVNNASVTIHVYGGDYSDCAYAFNVHDNVGQPESPVILLHEGIAFQTFLKNGTTDVIKSDFNNNRIGVVDGCQLETVNGANTVVKAEIKE